MEKEFGPIEYSDNSKIDEERYIMDVPAAIIVGVMIRGITFLTNHRFAFYAVVPDLNDEGNGSSGRKITGTATIHFASSFRPKKRAFLVLGSDSLNAFSSPRRLDQPWGCKQDGSPSQLVSLMNFMNCVLLQAFISQPSRP